MLKRELVDFLNNKYPFNNQEEWDSCGIDAEQETTSEVSNILVTLDLNKISLKWALENDCNVIITHHPLFKTDVEHPDNLVINVVNKELFGELQKNNILHIALHTCFDKDKQGTSYLIYEKVFKNYATLNELRTRKSEYLVYGSFNKEYTLLELVQLLKENHSFNNLRYLFNQENIKVKTFAIGAGSCSSMTNEVLKYKTDLFMTGDYKWHGFQDALNSNLVALDIGHDAEQVFIDKIFTVLKEKYSDLKIFKLKNSVMIKG